MKLQSLRSRLIAIILTPLLLIAVAAAIWQFRNATQRAEEIFDRGLLSAALAISRDIAVSGGDALSHRTRGLISDTSGGEVFYHVYAPDGVFVTGYATPPVPPFGVAAVLDDPLYYDGRYQGREVRVLRFQDAMSVEGLSGLYNITVWQNIEVRKAFARDVLARAFGVIALLVMSAALVVWFGVGLGLRPLLDLQEAIAKRSPSELDPIRRSVPAEVRGLVSTLNTLLERVSRRISSKDEFIANAAHQLRNPIAGVLALAEAVESAPSKDAKSRSAGLVEAARNLSHLANQLLSFERASGSDTRVDRAALCLNEVVQKAIVRFEEESPGSAISISYTQPERSLYVRGDELMLQEALLNLFGNAIVHGGPRLTMINVALSASGDGLQLLVSDDGIGILAADRERAITRFGQVNSGPGSGLGLPIAARVAESHGGDLTILECATGATVRLRLPLCSAPKRT